MVGTRKPGKGQNMENYEKQTLVFNVCNVITYFWMKLGAS
jgi:hypothetical protein